MGKKLEKRCDLCLFYKYNSDDNKGVCLKNGLDTKKDYVCAAALKYWTGHKANR
jgi:hypothetical protein